MSAEPEVACAAFREYLISELSARAYLLRGARQDVADLVDDLVDEGLVVDDLVDDLVAGWSVELQTSRARTDPHDRFVITTQWEPRSGVDRGWF